LTYRIITVPKKIHDYLPNRGGSPLHEFEGKNVGIRYARGEFVVCTNQGKKKTTHWIGANDLFTNELGQTFSLDDIWSHNFHNAIKSRAFKKNVIYLQYQDPHNM
jgi:hypothetical protein